MRSNEPPCLTQNEPPCLVHHHMHASRIFFFFSPSPAQKKNNHHHKSAFKRAPVSRASCVRHESFFPFSLLPKKKNNRHTQVRSNEPPCLVHRHMHASRIFFFFPLPLPKKKIIIITKVRSNEPPCLVQNEPPCLVHHACVTNLFFPSPGPPKKKKKIATHKCVQTSPRVSRRTSPRVSCIVICMRHGSFFFSPLSPAQKKNNHHRKSAFKRAPVSHAERAPVSRASSYACVTNLFFFPPCPLPKKK